MRRLLVLAALVLAWPALAAPSPVASVTVERSGDVWTADYRFHQLAPVWVFADSILPREGKISFRATNWTVETPGVRLERRGWYDVLVADSGAVPDRVTIRFTPFTDDIEASYDAALAFTDGSVALYGGKFEVFPAESSTAVEKLPIDLNEVAEANARTNVVMRDSAGPVLLGSRRVVEAVLDEPGTYVLFGTLDPVESEALATVVDPELPQWLASLVTSAIPAVLDRYAERMGPPPGRKPLLLASWAGPTAGVTSMGGSVLDSMVVMTFEGEGLRAPNERVASRALWFAAHEGAHFWLGRAVSYERPQDAWITEGGADLLAYRAVADANPAFDARAALQEALDACVAASLEGGIASANERGDHKAYYNCGAIFGLVAEKASGGDFSAFVRDLIQSNRGDGKVSRSEWLAALDSRAPGKGLVAAISRLLDTPAADWRPWAKLLESGNVPHRVTPGGSIELR
jgi:hypothetical protein